MENSFKKEVDQAKADIRSIREDIVSLEAAIISASKAARDGLGGIGKISTPDGLNKAIKELNDSLSNLNENLKKQSKNTDTLTGAKKRLKSITSDEAVNQRALAKSADLQAASTSKVVGAYANLQAKVKQAKKAYADLLSSQKPSTIELKKAKAELIKYQAKLNSTNRATSQFSKNSVRGLARGLKDLARAFGVTSAVIAFSQAIKNSFTRIRDFDKSMQNLSGVLQSTRKEIKTIEDVIISVAGSSVKTSREVAELAETLATLGKRGQDLTNLIKPANDLSIALQSTSAEAAEFLVQTLNAFGEPSSSADKFARTITAIRTSTTLDFQRMRDSFQYMTGISRILNLDLADTGGLIGTLVDNGLKAESSGRILGTALQKLGKEGNTLTGALNSIKEAQQEGVKEYELLALASSLFGKQGAKVGIILANNTDETKKSTQAIRDNESAMKDLVDKQLESVDAKLKILDSTWESLILTIDNGNGSISRFVKGVSDGLSGYLQELLSVEEAQSRVFKATGKEKGFSFIETSLKSLSFGLIDIQTDYEDLIEIQRGFNESLSFMDSNTSLGFLKDQMDELSRTLKNNTDLTEDQRKVYFQQLQSVENLYNSNVKLRKELEEDAREIVKVTGSFDDFGSKIDVLSNEQLKVFISKNKDAVKSLKPMISVLTGEGFTSLDSLNDKLKELNKTRDAADVYGDPEYFKKLTAEIKETQKEIDKIEGNKRKTPNAPNDEPKKGSIAFLEKRIALFEKERKELSVNSHTYRGYTATIEQLKETLSDVSGGFEFDTLKGGKVETKTIGSAGNSELELFKVTQDAKIKALQDFKSQYEGINDEILENQEKKSKKEAAVAKVKFDDIKAAVTEVTDTFSEMFDIDIDKFDFLFDGIKNTVSDWASASKEAISVVLDATTNKYEIELQEAQRTRDLILQNDLATEKQKRLAKEKFDKEERAIKTKKAKEDRKNNLIKIAVDTAVGVVSALANPGGPAGIVLAGVVGALGIAQGVAVASQPLPKFAEGHLSGTYSGKALINDANRSSYQEVVERSGGQVEIYKNRNEVIDMKKGDKVHKSPDSFLSYHNIDRDVLNMSIRAQQETLSNNREKDAIVGKIDELKGEFVKTSERMERLAKRPINNHNHITISRDYDNYNT